MEAETRAKEAEAAAQAEWRQCGLWPSARETRLHCVDQCDVLYFTQVNTFFIYDV